MLPVGGRPRIAPLSFWISPEKPQTAKPSRVDANPFARGA